MRSNPVHRISLIFQLENILRSNLNLSTSYGRSTNLKSLLGLLLVSFLWLGEKISLQYLLIGGVDVCVHLCPMSRPCRLCPKWLRPLRSRNTFFELLIKRSLVSVFWSRRIPRIFAKSCRSERFYTRLGDTSKKSFTDLGKYHRKGLKF